MGAGQGVSSQVQQGCPLHQQCKGSGAALNYTHQDKTLSAAHFRQGAHAYTLHRIVMHSNVNVSSGINCACTPCSYSDVKQKIERDAQVCALLEKCALDSSQEVYQSLLVAAVPVTA